MTVFEDACLLRSAPRTLFALGLLAGVGFTGATTALAQPAPQAFFVQSVVPPNLPDVPARVLIGDTFKFKVRFKNNTTGTGNIGYGPFIDLAVNFAGADSNASSQPCDGIDIDITGIKMIDVNGGPIPLTSTSTKYGNMALGNCSSVSAPHPFAGVGTITFPAGWQVVTIALPFGSFVPIQPEVVLEITAKLHDYADRNFALAVCARGGFQFGSTATGGTPIVETSNNVATWTAPCPTVTPEVLIVNKEYVGPEDETATGPNFVHKYKISLDVATGQPIGNPLSLQDCMPNGMAYQGNLNVTAPAGWGPYVATAPAIGAIGACLDVSWPNGGTQVVGVPGVDAHVQFDFFVADHYANGGEVLDDKCVPVVLSNAVKVTGTWKPLDTRDPTNFVNVASQAHQLSAKCLAIQKSVAVRQEFPGGGIGPTPGDILQYKFELQATDYKTFGQIVINDSLSNGQVFLTSPAPTLRIGDRFGLNLPIPLLPAYYTATPALASTPDCPRVPRSTSIFFNISGALAAIPSTSPRHLAGILTGGYAAAPNSPTPATGTLIFYARIADAFTGVALPVGYVDKHDRLCNAVEIQGTVHLNDPVATTVPPAVVPTRIAKDTSGTRISVVSDVLTKSVRAVKRGALWSCGPSFLVPTPPHACLPGEQVFPGDQVTFHIGYPIPSGDAQSVTIRDFLPLPKFDVTGMTMGPPCSATAVPAMNLACRTPAHTLATGPNLTPQPVSNSILFSYGTLVFNTANTLKIIDLLFTTRVTNQPMIDGLLLTNEAQECEKNTFDISIVFCQTAIAQVQVREPMLNVRKGAIASDSLTGVFTQPGQPQLAQAPALATFSLGGVGGQVTSGPPSAIGTLFHSNLLNVDAYDLATFAVVIENTGGYPAFNVHLDDFIPWDKSAGLPTCFEFAPHTSISITNGAGVVLTPILGSGASNFGVTFLNTLNIPAVNPTGSNIVIITFQVKIIDKIQAGCCKNEANLTQYTSSPNPNSPNFVAAGVGGPFADSASICVGPSASAKCIQATSEAHTTPQQSPQGGQVQGAIGEIVRFRLVTVIPEGTTQNLQIRDALPVGMTYIPGTARATFVANTAVGNPHGIPTADPPGQGAMCPGVPTPMTAISADPGSFPVGAGTAPSFPAVPITITNTDNDADLEYLVIEFNAQVDNIATNQDIPPTTLPNTFAVSFTDAFSGQTSNSGSGPVYVAVVEPKLTLTKTANPTVVGPAGGIVTYSVTIANTGSAAAFDFAFNDVLPADFVPGSVSLGTIPAGCTGQPIVGLNLGVTCPGLPVAGTMTLTYQATVKPQSCPAAMTNNATATWTSLPGPNGTVSNLTGSATAGLAGAGDGERDGVTLPAFNDYHAAGAATIQCVIPTAALTIGKLYDHPAGMTFPTGAPLSFTADCSDPANTGTPHMTQTVILSSGGNQLVLPGIPVGWTCNVTETVPPATGGCYWAPGIAVTPNPVTIQAVPAQSHVVFKNNYVCSGNANYDLSVTKTPLNPGSGGPKGFVITVQNVGNNSLSAADLSHLTVTDNMPGGSMITSYGNTDPNLWTCLPAPASLPAPAPAQCSYSGSAPLAPFAGLPQLQIMGTAGPGTTQYVNPVTGTVVNSNLALNCVVIALTGTGSPNHDDPLPLNNLMCIQM